MNRIRDRKIKDLINRTLLIVCGVILSTVPWVIYFGVHGAIKDWLEVYFYDNLFLYTAEPVRTTVLAGLPVIGGLVNGVVSSVRNIPVTAALLILFLAVMLQYRKERLAALYIAAVLGTFTVIFIGGQACAYYSLPMNGFLAPSLALVCAGMTEKRIEPIRKLVPLAAVLCLVCMYLFTPNRSFMNCKKEDLAQYQFRQMIEGNQPGATILNYGSLDGGFYTACDVLPNCRAYYLPNVLKDELLEVQDSYVSSGLCDYVITLVDPYFGITINAADPEKDPVENTVVKNEVVKDFRMYDRIAELKCPSNGSVFTYQLYRRKISGK